MQNFGLITGFQFNKYSEKDLY